MEKGKRMNKIIPFIVILVVVAVLGTVSFIKSRPQQIARGEIELDRMLSSADADENRMPISMEADRVGIGESEKMLNNQDYIENQVVAVAESKREAKKIAKQIGGELLSYDNQVAVIQIGVTVEEMMQQLEEDSTLPKVYPNYQGYQNNTN
ncbi:MAG: hypothetical protein HDR05_09470 [Lachnospiraceae bacterium]|nr:hypothetical protein [Lachnospiraceae bacterium]